MKYLNVDFAKPEKDPDTGMYMYRIDGYLYDSYEDSDTPYRHVQFQSLYVPADKISSRDYINALEAGAKQYMTDLNESTAEEIIFCLPERGLHPDRRVRWKRP